MRIRYPVIPLVWGSLMAMAASGYGQTSGAPDGVWKFTSATTNTQTLVDGTDLNYTVSYAGNPSGNADSYVTITTAWNGTQYRLYGGTTMDVASKGKAIQITNGKSGDTGTFRTTPAVQSWRKTGNANQTLADGTNMTYSITYAGSPSIGANATATVEVAWSGNRYQIATGNSIEVATKGLPIRIIAPRADDTGTFQALQTVADIPTPQHTWKFPASTPEMPITDGTSNIYRIAYSGTETTFITVNVGWNGGTQRVYGGTSIDVSSSGKPITLTSPRTGDAGTYTVVGATKSPEDVNGDSLVNILDAIQVLRAVVGL